MYRKNQTNVSDGHTNVKLCSDNMSVRVKTFSFKKYVHVRSVHDQMEVELGLWLRKWNKIFWKYFKIMVLGKNDASELDRMRNYW